MSEYLELLTSSYAWGTRWDKGERFSLCFKHPVLSEILQLASTAFVIKKKNYFAEVFKV